MIPLSSTFNSQSGFFLSNGTAMQKQQGDALAGTGGGTVTTDTLTYEMRDDPARSLVRAIEKEIERNPAQALLLARTVPKGALYDAHADTIEAARVEAMHQLVLQNEANARKPQTALAMQFLPLAAGTAVYTAQIPGAAPAMVMRPLLNPGAPSPFDMAGGPTPWVS